MDMKARNQYPHTLITERGGYHKVSKRRKSHILDEYCRVTGQHRTAVSRKIRTGSYVHTMRKEIDQERRTRSSHYTGDVVTHLVRIYVIFDRPCGQRLAPIMRTELDRLRRFGEITISDDMARLLKKMSPRDYRYQAKTTQGKRVNLKEIWRNKTSSLVSKDPGKTLLRPRTWYW